MPSQALLDKIAADRLAIEAAEKVLDTDLAALTADPVPPPVVVPPPADPTLGVVTTTTPNMARAIIFAGWMAYPNSYERVLNATVLKAGANTVRIMGYNGGMPMAYGFAGVLNLLFDGKPVASKIVAATDTATTFTVDITDIPEGSYRTSVSGFDSSWSVCEYDAYVLKGAVAQPQTRLPVTTASHELVFESGGKYQSAWVPARNAPVLQPYAPRTFPDHPVIPAGKNLIITSLAVPRPGDSHRPFITKDGVITTAGRQNYYYFDFENNRPILPMLDGPRGQGSIIAPVHLEVGNAAPNGNLRGNVYFIEQGRIGKVTPDGTIVTLSGWRHKSLPGYWADPNIAELVGDWSSIPVARRGYAQPWGMAWDPRTLVISATGPIAAENNELPHVLSPVLYVSDTYNNRVLKHVFSATAHGVPPVVTEYITGLNQPWDCLISGTLLYVSDRLNNAIKVYDLDTAALTKTYPVVQPEGMALQDGWLYYASVKSKAIRKIELATGKDVLIADPTVSGSSMGYYINNNSRFMKIAVSDGTFGPRGMIAYTTWSNIYYGFPILLDPNGKFIDWTGGGVGAAYGIRKPLGLGSYSTAVALGHGRMLFGTAEDGLHVVSKALPTDTVLDWNKYLAGRDQYQARGFALTHGPGGYGYYGLPLPFGVTGEVDYFLAANGHKP